MRLTKVSFSPDTEKIFNWFFDLKELKIKFVNLVDSLSASLQANCALANYKEKQKAFQPNNYQNLQAQVELHEVFEYLGLSKYTDVFMQQEVKFPFLSKLSFP